MSKDLEEQLNEMGPEYRAIVARLRGAMGEGEDFRRKTGDGRGHETLDGRRGLASKVLGLRSKVLRPVLVAASIALILGLGVVFLGRKDFRPETGDGGYGAREYRADVSEMIATQNPDGSWKNDFLTRRNAAALKGSSNPAAAIAYKKAMRNLRTRGVL